jgi:hypothetical protein
MFLHIQIRPKNKSELIGYTSAIPKKAINGANLSRLVLYIGVIIAMLTAQM